MAQSGPFRIFPGRLSVSRSFGDPEAKLNILGGNQNVLITIPDIKSFRIKKETDFILIGCDGIFDRLTNGDVIHSIWSMCTETNAGKDINDHCGRISDLIIRNCLASGANDNLTCIFISFDNFKNLFYEPNIFKMNFDIIEKIFKNMKNINNETFKEKEDGIVEINQIYNTNNNTIINFNNVLNNPSPRENTKQVNKNENLFQDKTKEKNNSSFIPSLQVNTNKIFSPVNYKNKIMSPSNLSLNNFNGNGTINYYNPNIIDDSINNKNFLSTKNMNSNSKTLVMTASNSTSNLNNQLASKKMSYNGKIFEDKNNCLPAINSNGNNGKK